jgi:DNA-binding PadR family transcriptional regulator
VALSPQVFQILLTLAEGERHGYAIIQDIRERTGGEMAITASTLYAALKRLLDARLIQEVDAAGESAGPERRHYRLTTAGFAAGRAEAERIDALAAMARHTRWLPRKRPAR